MTGNLREHDGLRLELLDGEMPRDLRGHVVIAGMDAQPGRPAFIGEGRAFRLDLEGALFTSRSLRPPCWYVDQALEARRANPLQRFRDVGLARISPLYGARSFPNTAAVAVGRRILVTGDVARPWEIDPVTLDLVTPIGALDEWTPGAPLPWMFPIVCTSAHPAIDPDTHDLYSINYVPSGPGDASETTVVRWAGGPLQRFPLVDEATGERVAIRQSAHQLALTEQYLVILDSAFTVELRQMFTEGLGLPVLSNWLPSAHMRAQSPENVFWVVNRRDLQGNGSVARARKVVIPQEANHFAARWENPQGQLTLVILHTPTQDVSEWIRPGERMVDGSVADPALTGLPIPIPLAGGAIGVHTITPEGAVESRLHEHPVFTMGLGLHTFTDAGGAGSPRSHLWVCAVGYCAAQVPARLATIYRDRLGPDGVAALRERGTVPGSLARIDLDPGRFDGWNAPPGWVLLSPTYVPSPQAAEPAGWLVVAALSDRTEAYPAASSGDEIWIFDAADVAHGPVCRLGHPTLDLAFTLHGAWVPSVAPSPRDYLVTVNDDYLARRPRSAGRELIAGAIGKLMNLDEVRELLRTEVIPRFPGR